MNSRVSWSVDGIDPSVRERAEAAARRAGMSLSDWLNSTIGDSAPPNFRSRRRTAAGDAEPGEPATSPTSTSGWIRSPARSSRFRGRAGRAKSTAPAASAAQRAGRRPAIERRHLAARCAAVADLEPGAGSARPSCRTAAPGRDGRARRSPGLSPFAAAQPGLVRFRDRGNRRAPERTRLRAPPRRRCRRAPPPPTAPCRAAVSAACPRARIFPRSSAICFKITSQIEALQRPDGIEQSIAAFRSELAEIRPAITEAMPRRAIESIENEIRSLSRRIDDTRQSGIDGQALAGIERALGEIREVLRSLTPAEQLAGYDEAIRNLGAKLDLILRANDDPSTVHQLEGAIAALRSIVSNVASNDALARLSDDVHMLSSKVDQLARSDGHGDSFAMLEQRIAALTSTLESREPPAAERKLRTARRRAAGAVRPHRPHAGRQRQRLGVRPSRTARVLSARAAGSLQRSPRRQSRPGRGRAAGHSAPSRNPACELCRAWPPMAAANAAAPPDGGLADHRQARIVRHPLQPVGNRPPHPGFARSRSQHARPCGRPAGDDRRRSAQRSAPRRSRRSRSRRRLPPHAPPQAAAPPRRDAAAAEARTAQSRRGTGHISPPRRANSMPREPPAAGSSRARRAPGASAKFWSRMPRRRAPRSSRICRPITRSSRARGRPGESLRHRSASRLPKTRSAKFRRARASRSARRASLPPPAAPPRPPRPRRPRDKAAPRASSRTPPAPGQGAVDDHLQDPLAAGRRERGRDRARHLQDGDDAARQRQRAADARDGEFERAASLRSSRPPMTAPSRRRRRRRRPR